MLESIYLTHNEPIFNPLCGNAPYYNILLCLMPDNFTRQVESAATQWVQLHCTLLYMLVLLCLTPTILLANKRALVLNGLTYK